MVKVNKLRNQPGALAATRSENMASLDDVAGRTPALSSGS